MNEPWIVLIHFAVGRIVIVVRHYVEALCKRYYRNEEHSQEYLHIHNNSFNHLDEFASLSEYSKEVKELNPHEETAYCI